MPYGVSAKLWARLPEDDKAAIKAEYEAGLAPPPVDSNLQPADAGGAGIPADPLDEILLDPDKWKAVLDFASGTGLGTGTVMGELTGYKPYDFGEDSTYFSETPSLDKDGGFGPLPPTTFSDINLSVAGAPEWWKAVAPNQYNPLSEYQTLTNLFIPFLSPEDQRTVAANLYQSDSKQFEFYDPETLELGAPPPSITPDIRQRFLSGQRATQALGSLDRFLQITGKKAEDFGPGYNFLRGIADTVSDFGLTSGAEQFTETQQSQLRSALDPLLAQVKSKNLAAFGPLAKSFAAPFFSAGSLQDSGPSKGLY